MAEREPPLLRRILGGIISNPFYKLLSLGIALTAWLYVQGGQLTDVRLRAALEWKLPPGLATTEPLPASVMLTVKGSRSATRRAQRADVRIIADLSEVDVGEHLVDFSSLDIDGLPPTVAVVGYAPSSARLVLDETTTRKVKVTSIKVGDPPRGYAVADVSVEPSVVEIRGPRIVLSDLVEVRTKPLDVSGLTGDAELPVELDLPWGLRVVGGSWLRARVDVEPLVEARVYEAVPVTVRAEGWAPSHDEVQVTLQGPASQLQAIGADDIAVFVHLPDNPARSSYEASFGPKEGLRLSVVHRGDDVSAVAVKPSVIQVVRNE